MPFPLVLVVSGAMLLAIGGVAYGVAQARRVQERDALVAALRAELAAARGLALSGGKALHDQAVWLRRRARQAVRRAGEVLKAAKTLKGDRPCAG
jgi:hypothetical protein